MDIFLVNFFTVLLFAYIGFLIYRKIKNKTKKALPQSSRQTKQAAQTHTIPAEIDGHRMAYHYSEVKLCIITGQEPYFNALMLGETVRFVQEPENSYDDRAVYAVTERGMKIGYLRKNRLQDMTNTFIEQGLPIDAFIDGIDAVGREVSLFMAFYR